MTRPLPIFRSLKACHPIHFIALLALIISALAPSGFMPTQTEQGFAIKLCSGHTDSQLAITPGHPDYALLAMVYGNQQEQEQKGDPENTAPDCAFAGGSSVGLASVGPEIALDTLAPATHEPIEPRCFALHNRINIPPATGPPVTI